MTRFNILLTAAIVSLSSLVAQAQNPPQQLASDLQDILDNSLPSEVAPGAVLSVYVPGEWTWSSATGNAISGETAGYPMTTATPGTKYRAGSISKMFTAASVMQMHDAGLLNITDNISQYLRASIINDTIPNGADITIQNLLEHTSGLGDAAANDSCQQDALANLTRDFTLEENIFCGSQFASLPPDLMMTYSNTNYALLAMLIEEVSGTSYAQYVTDNIITPLGLTNTYIPVAAEDEIATAHMGCYWWVIPGTFMADMTVVDASLYRGWANIVSDTEDLTLFYEALRSEQVITASSFNQMFTLSSLSSWYGMGAELTQLSGTNYYGHSGEVGNTSGLYFSDISTSEFPNGYYIAYNFNYQGVNFTSKIDLPVFNLMSSYLTGVDEEMTVEVEVGNGFPNPTANQFTLPLHSGGFTNAAVTVHNLAGQEVLAPVAQDITPGPNNISVDVSALSPGMYIYHIQVADRAYNGRINVVSK
jgi:D-alanyl-D-alanine carboxypeptidase